MIFYVKGEDDVIWKSSRTKLLLVRWIALGVELIVIKIDRIWDKIKETSHLIIEIFMFSVSKGVLWNSQLYKLSNPLQADETLLYVTCCVRLHTLSSCMSMYVVSCLLGVVAQSMKPVKLLSQQIPKSLLFRDGRSEAQQCWIRLHSSSNIVGATHAHYT